MQKARQANAKRNRAAFTQLENVRIVLVTGHCLAARLKNHCLQRQIGVALQPVAAEGV